MRAIQHIHTNNTPHWVGDGFYVKTLISHFDNNPEFNYHHTDPFLLLDYGAPKTFLPNPQYDTHPYGVGQHPHKGFETVTIAYLGSISHADSAGGRGEIMEGDIQWMTAGRGIMHEEFHSKAFGQQGGVFSMVQMWINLPSTHKLVEPNYQTLKRAELPIVELMSDNNANDGEHLPIGKAAIIAGEWYETIGSARTFTPVNLWDIELQIAGTTILDVPDSHNVMILIQQGEVLVNDMLASAGQLVQFVQPIQNSTETSATDTIKLTYAATTDKDADTNSSDNRDNRDSQFAKVLLMSGEPIGEPIASYGPFVMNTEEEIKQTFRDYQTGNFV